MQVKDTHTGMFYLLGAIVLVDLSCVVTLAYTGLWFSALSVLLVMIAQVWIVIAHWSANQRSFRVQMGARLRTEGWKEYEARILSHVYFPDLAYFAYMAKDALLSPFRRNEEA